MKYLYAMLCLIILLYLFLFLLFNLPEYGLNGILFAGFTGFALYKTIRLLYLGYKAEERKMNHTDTAVGCDWSNPVDFLLFSEPAGDSETQDNDKDDWDEWKI